MLLTLASLSVAELRHFQEFLSSTYCVKHREVRRLGQHLLGLAPDFPEARVKKEVLFAEAFPEKTFDPAFADYLANLLLEHLEKFLVFQAVLEDAPAGQVVLLQELSRRNLFGLIDSRIKRFKNTTQRTGQSIETFYLEYVLNRVELESRVNRSAFKEIGDLHQVGDSLDNFFVLAKLELACIRSNLQTGSVGEPIELWLLEESLGQALKKNDQGLVKLFAYMLQLTRQPDDALFDQFFADLAAEESRINPKDLKTIYSLAINYAIRQSRTSSVDYLLKALELYRRGFDNKCLLEDGYLLHRNFINVVRLGLLANELNWVTQFVVDFQDKIRPEWKEEAVNIAQAEINFHRRDFDAVKVYVSKFNFLDFIYQLNARVLLLKTYFENREREDDLLVALIAAVKMFLQRNKQIPRNSRTATNNFVNLLNSLLNGRASQAEKLHERIRTTEPLVERRWLEEKWTEVFRRPGGAQARSW